MKIIVCPQCKKPHEYSLDNAFRPFCGERCKLIDLGQWADERFKIPCQEDDSENFQENKKNSEEENDN